MALFNRSTDEIEPYGPLATSFGAGTHPIGENRFGLRGVVPGIYRVEAAPDRHGKPRTTITGFWSLHNALNPDFGRLAGGHHLTPFLIPVADAKFVTVNDENTIWTLVEAY